VERAVILSDGDSIKRDDLFLESREQKRNIDNLEKQLISEVLESCSSDIDRASEILGMNQSALKRKIEKYSLKD
jgi:DNA-binding NtrC family response regulator